MISVLIFTPLPTPYQVELFDSVAASGRVNLTVLYSMRTHPVRSWRIPEITHRYYVLSEVSARAAQEIISQPDLVVFSGYHPRRLRTLISYRHSTGKAWAFWGEKPGTVLPPWLSRYYKTVMIPELRSNRVPIWGIGTWAVNGYRAEYGEHRKILDVPYFSNLNRFLRIDRSNSNRPARRFLFSGTLSKRKGVDLLIKAFVKLADEFSDIQLDLIGSGPLERELRRMCAPVSDRVHFHGFKQWEELPEYYANADVLCAPSRYDGWGLIVPEALAAGLLVVSTNQTGAALDLLSSGHGWVVPHNTLNSLMKAMRAAASLSGDDRLVQIEQGRKVASAHDVGPGADQVLMAIRESLAHWNTGANFAGTK